MAKRITELTSATVLAETDLLPVVDTSDTTQATSGTTKKSALSLIADYLKARVETLTNKTLSTGSVVDANVNVVEILKKAYPVGSIYINASVSTNPATLFGFGTWSAFGAGRTLVGIDSGDTDFDTVEETGGAKTSLLTREHLPYSVTDEFQNNSGSAKIGAVFGSIANGSYGISSAAYSGLPANQPHTNLQPYIVVYFWKRTA